MKPAALALWASLAFASGAAAQSVTPATYMVASLRAFPSSASGAAASPALPSDPAESMHEPVYGVLQDLDFQVYGGFTYFRFYELPGVTGNLAGLNVSLAYYPHAGHLGADGEFAFGFASQNGNTTLGMGMGGGRLRISTPRHTEVWVHALAGGAHFIPKTPYGSESAFAFEAGGGADWSPHGDRFAFRVQADLLGTYFFGTHQYGPKISLGVAYQI